MKNWKAVNRVFKERGTFSLKRILNFLSLCFFVLLFFVSFDTGYKYNGKDYSDVEKAECKQIAETIINDGIYRLPRFDNLEIKSNDRVDIIEAISYGIKDSDTSQYTLSMKVYDWKVITGKDNTILFSKPGLYRWLMLTYTKDGSIGMKTYVPDELRSVSGFERGLIVVLIAGAISLILYVLVKAFFNWKFSFDHDVEYAAMFIEEEEKRELEEDRKRNAENEAKARAEKEQTAFDEGPDDDDYVIGDADEAEDENEGEAEEDDSLGVPEYLKGEEPAYLRRKNVAEESDSEESVTPASEEPVSTSLEESSSTIVTEETKKPDEDSGVEEEYVEEFNEDDDEPLYDN